MARKDIFTCDLCGVERKDANHWFRALLSAPMGMGGAVIVSISKWAHPFITFSSQPATLDANEKHFCGQACVHKFVDEFLSK